MSNKILSQNSDGDWILQVRAKPGGRVEKLRGVHENSLRVEITSPPEKGKANAAIIKLLAKTTGLAKRDITLLSGSTSREKKFLLHAPTPAQLENINQMITAH